MSAYPVTLRLRADTRLRSRAARGDADAFAAVYERHHQALYRYCRSLLRDEHDAQDALQNTLTRAFAALQHEERDFELRPWLFRIAHNEAVTLIRQRRGTATLDETQPSTRALEDRVAEREELRLLRTDLADLPDRQRAALVLRELLGLSHHEIGQVLDLPPSGVKQALFDARTSLSNAREGRALACGEVRRKLSDGDGRVLRGRGVRAHLRSCSGCRDFRAELAIRPRELKLLAPPLPAAGAASLLSQLLGGTAVKLLACAALVGGGTTVATVQMHSPSRAPAREKTQVERVAASAATLAPTAAAAGRAFVAPVASPVVRPAERATPVKAPERPKRRGGRHAAAPTPAAAHTPAASRHPKTPRNPAAPAATAEPQTHAEAPPSERPATDRDDAQATTPAKDKTQTKTPPGQVGRPPKREQTNNGRGHDKQPAVKPQTSAERPGNGNGNGNGGGNGNATAQAPAQSESPGNSGAAPGHRENNTDSGPGNPNAGGNGNGKGNAEAGGNGNSANAPGHTKPEKPDTSF